MHDGRPHLLCHRALVLVAGAVLQPLINVNSDFEAVADVSPGRAHNIHGLCNLLLVLQFEQNAVMHQHVRDEARLAQAPCCQSQHFRTATLHWKVV